MSTMSWESWHGAPAVPEAPSFAGAPPPSRSLEPSPRTLAPLNAPTTTEASRSSTAANKDMASPPSKKPDDPDSPCRPRLTSEQTAFLEDYFAHTPRPTTVEKKQHAEQLGLTQDKVNNWFQNRRAKSKQQVKTRQELSVLPPDDPRLQHYLEHGADYPLPTSPLQFSEQAEPMIFPNEQPGWMPQLTHAGSWPLSNTMVYADGNLIGHHGQGYAAAPTPDTPPAVQAPTHWAPDGDFSSASSTYQESLPEYALAPSSSAHSLLDGGFDHGHGLDAKGLQFPLHPEPPMPHRLLLQDPIVIPASGQVYGTRLLELEPAPLPASNISLRLQAATNSLSQSAPPQSPRPEQQREFSETFSRSESNASDQATTQRPSPLDSDRFRMPDDTNLALRRKQRRPANLVPMRAVSASTTADGSPRSKTATLPTAAVRRIKSSGHPLNVHGGRVSKPGVPTPTHSPRNVTFLEALAREESYAGDSDAYMTHQLATWSAAMADMPSRNASFAATSPSSFGAPPLSASCTQTPFEESFYFASPPITPFFPQPVASDAQAAAWDYLAHFEPSGDMPPSTPPHISGFGAMPQSAPAHVTTFGQQWNVSPPSSAHLQPSRMGPHGHRLGSMGPKPWRDTPFYAPQPLTPAAQLPSQMASKAAAFDAMDAVAWDGLPPDAGPFSAGYIPRPSSASGMHAHGSYSGMSGRHPTLASYEDHAYQGRGHSTFLAAPQPPPQKELEVVMAQFPSPATQPLPLRRPGQGPQAFTFQNTGPGDFQERDSE